MGKAHAPGFLKLVQDAKTRVPELTVEEVKAMLDAGERFVLVDVREDHEWAQDHLPGAVHLSKGTIEPKDFVYFLSIIVLGLFATNRAVEAHRWS